MSVQGPSPMLLLFRQYNKVSLFVYSAIWMSATGKFGMLHTYSYKNNYYALLKLDCMNVVLGHSCTYMYCTIACCIQQISSSSRWSDSKELYCFTSRGHHSSLPVVCRCEPHSRWNCFQSLPPDSSAPRLSWSWECHPFLGRCPVLQLFHDRVLPWMGGVCSWC